MKGPAAIILHPDDNVMVCTRAVRAGEALIVGGERIIARQAVGAGHKIARGEFAVGDKVIKYGMPIGSFTAPVTRGEWIHLHNMKSDYIDPHTRADQAADHR